MPYKRFLGYEKGEDGTPKIVESEAEIVRMIYRMFIDGKTSSAIAKNLTDNGLPTPGGKKRWQVSTVDSMLTNEKYKGDALLQKRFTVDFLSKKIKDNEGEVPQYYVQNSHPGIVDPDEFDAVQVEIERRKNLGRPSACQSPLSTKLICGECGGFYGAKVWGSNTKYRRVIWQCNEKYKSQKRCTTPHVTDEEVKQKFLTAFNSLLSYRDELIANCRLAQSVLCDGSEIEFELDELHREIEVLAGLSRMVIQENAHIAISQEEWLRNNSSYLDRYRKASERVTELEGTKRERLSKNHTLDRYIRNLESQGDTIDVFDEKLWMGMIDKVTVMSTGRLVYIFKDGTEIEI